MRGSHGQTVMVLIKTGLIFKTATMVTNGYNGLMLKNEYSRIGNLIIRNSHPHAGHIGVRHQREVEPRSTYPRCSANSAHLLKQI